MWMLFGCPRGARAVAGLADLGNRSWIGGCSVSRPIEDLDSLVPIERCEWGRRWRARGRFASAKTAIPGIVRQRKAPLAAKRFGSRAAKASAAFGALGQVFCCNSEA